MRFPDSPQFLMNAEALGADATEVAYEELFLALQQGTVDGQENPIINIDAINLDEVQDYISLSSHQANSNLVIIGEVWDELSSEQQDALQAPSTRPSSRSRAASRRTRRRPSPSGRSPAPSRWSTTSTWRRSAPRSTPTCGRTSTRSSSPSTRASGRQLSDRSGGSSDARGARRRPSDLGTTLIHEHLFVGHPELDLNFPHPEWDEAAAVDAAVAGTGATVGARRPDGRRPHRARPGPGRRGGSLGWPTAPGCSWSPRPATTPPTCCRRTSTPTAPGSSSTDLTRWWHTSSTTSGAGWPAPACAPACSRSSPTGPA